jgi:alcohol dehydrogenase, propanol-preferring
MKAMVARGVAAIDSSPLVVEDLPIPEPGPGQVRVAVRACGICRTDLHVIEGDLPAVRDAIVPGHQVVGVVDARGPGASRFNLGDRVGIAWLRHVCGTCRYCRAGRENLCESARFTGYHEHGGYAEYAVVHQDFAYAIPAALGDAEATPLLCAGIIGYRALSRAALPAGGRLGLYGFGSSAHIVLQLARHRGAEVLVATRGEGHRQLARSMGAAWAGEADEPMPAPLDSAIVFAPVGTLVPPALRALAKGGTCALAGIYMTDVPPLSYEDCLFYEKTLVSVTANTRADGEGLLREAAAVALRPQVTCFALADANRALQQLKGDGINGSGVLITPSRVDSAG